MRTSLKLLCGLFLLPSLSAHADTAARYLHLRAVHHCTSLTLAQVCANPQGYNSKVLEITGTVTGEAGGASSPMLVLNLDAAEATPLLNSLTLQNITPSQMAGLNPINNPRVRVLLQAVYTADSNLPDWKTLSIALDSQVTSLQQIRAARSLQQNRARALRQERARQSARGGFVRPPLSGDAMAQMAYYSQYLDSRLQTIFAPYYSFIAHENPKLSPAQAGKITYYLLSFSEQYQVDPRLVVAMIIAESDFDPNSTSSTGAAGLGQLMPDTGKELGLSNPYSIEQNLQGSIYYLHTRLNMYSSPANNSTFEQIRLAMAAYNAGAGAVKKYGGVPPFHETRAYVRKVISIYKKLLQ